jgi:hypothetical protein
MQGITRAIIVLFILPWTANALGDYSWSDRCIRAQEACLRLDYKESRRLIAEEKRSRPDNLIPLFIEAKADFLQAFLMEEDSLVELLKHRNTQRIELFKKGKPDDPYYRLCIAELYLYQAAARLKSKEFFGVVYDTRKANTLLLENRKLHPGFKPNLLGSGFIHCVTGAIPKNYQWLAGLLGFEGTVNEGLSELRSLLGFSIENKSLRHLHDETLLCLTFIELALLPKADHNIQLKRFASVENLDRKPLVVYAKGAVLTATGKNDSVISMLERIKTATEQQSFKFLYLMEGNARLFKLDPSAENCYLRFLQIKGGKTYRHSILQRLAWTRLIQEDRAGYRRYLKQVSTLGSAGHLTDEDRSAIAEWESQQEPNILLLKARLLFDGGYYRDAFNVLAGQPATAFPRFRDQLEFTYRLARIYDKQGKREPAIGLYESTLKNGAAHSFYFAANSALHLGQLYESTNDRTKAKAYYKRVLELHNHEFQNSIDQKAKAGLNRLSYQ